MFIMNFNRQTNQVTYKPGPDSKLVTVRTFVTVMGILHLEKDIKDRIVQYFL